MYRRTILLSIGIMAALVAGACQPVVPVEPDTPINTAKTEQSLAPTKPLRILFIGDTYSISSNWGEDGHLAGLATASMPPLLVETDKVVAGGEDNLKDIWDAGDALDKLKTGAWDAVVLQQDMGWFAMDIYTHDASPEVYAVQEEIFIEYASKFAQEASKLGANTVLCVPVDYLEESFVSLDDFVEMVETVAARSGAQIAPIGQAENRLRETDSEIRLYDTDGTPTIFGTYLGAATLYAVLFSLDPTEIDYSPADILPDHRSLLFLRAQYEEIPAGDLAFLRQIAWETVQDYQTGQ